MNLSQIESKAAKLVSWAPVFQKFEESGLSQRKFCQQEKLDLSTFRKWLHLNNQRALIEAREKASFVPVQLGFEAAGQELVEQSMELVVTLPLGVTLHFRGRC
jgi:hypothetical protein